MNIRTKDIQRKMIAIIKKVKETKLKISMGKSWRSYDFGARAQVFSASMTSAWLSCAAMTYCFCADLSSPSEKSAAIITVQRSKG